MIALTPTERHVLSALIALSYPHETSLWQVLFMPVLQKKTDSEKVTCLSDE